MNYFVTYELSMEHKEKKKYKTSALEISYDYTCQQSNFSKFIDPFYKSNCIKSDLKINFLKKIQYNHIG